MESAFTNKYLLYKSIVQMRLLGECRGSIDTMKRMGFELKEEEDTVSGLADPSSSESQTSGNTAPSPLHTLP